MGQKVNEIYYIPTEEFCAIDNNSEIRFFLKTVRPDVHKEFNSCMEKALEISETIGKYPNNFVSGTKRDIFDRNDLSLYIPVRIIKEKKEYLLCEDSFSHKEFIIPRDLVYNLDDSQVMALYNMAIYSNYWYAHANDMEFMMDLFHSELNLNKRSKSRRKRKDTK